MNGKGNRNALAHGVHSSDVILPWEREEDFEELLEGVRRDFQPVGTTENEFVFLLPFRIGKSDGSIEESS